MLFSQNAQDFLSLFFKVSVYPGLFKFLNIRNNKVRSHNKSENCYITEAFVIRGAVYLGEH